MDFDPFPISFSSPLRADLAAPLRNLLVHSNQQGAKCTWHENCRLLRLVLPPDFSTDEPVEKYLQTEPELWHHQLKLDGKPLLYAHSVIEHLPLDESRPRLIELVQSTTASWFDDTQDVLEALESVETVRLLVVPRFNKEFFALFEGDVLRRFVPLRSRTEWNSIPPPEMFIQPHLLLKRLRGMREFLGLRSR